MASAAAQFSKELNQTEQDTAILDLFLGSVWTAI
jgi:hypothetical protein